MCIGAPKIPKTPPPAQFQQMQAPKDLTTNKSFRRRRGLYASIFTSPQGVTAPVSVTGTSGGVTGG